jgi:hypothetical protein
MHTDELFGKRARRPHVRIAKHGCGYKDKRK